MFHTTGSGPYHHSITKQKCLDKNAEGKPSHPSGGVLGLVVFNAFTQESGNATEDAI